MQTCLKTDSVELRPNLSLHADVTREVIDVKTGEVKVATEGAILRSVAIGSCVAVAALNFKRKTGALAHIMLPGNAPQHSLEKTKYAFDGIEQLLNQMFEAGANTDEIEVCLVGGGNVLKKEDDTICEANIESITQILKGKNIPVMASVLGGTKRKSVFLDVEKGRISYTETDEKEKILWQASQLN